MKCVVLFILLVAVSLAATDEELFLSFMKKYHKSYTSDEFQLRLSIFRENLKIAADLNSKDPYADYGITKFMDLSQEEFKDFFLMKNFTSPKMEGKPINYFPIIRNSTLPENFDWNSRGKVTGTYNQGQCGSCWAFSVTENIESMWAISGHSLESLSMQQLVDCDHSSGGCNGGYTTTAFEYIHSCGGQDSYKSYPYTAADGSCRFNKDNIAAKISGWNYITQNDNIDDMMDFIYNHGPPSVCVDAVTWQYYNGGIITGNCGNQIDHCVQITGFQVSDGMGVWRVRNSWGSDFGYGGYLYVKRAGNVCLIGDEVTSCTI